MSNNNCVPWIIHNQTTFPVDPSDPSQSVILINPPGYAAGLVGEVTTLPYQVPTGKQLTINYLAIEGLWGAAMFPWIGTSPDSPGQVVTTFTTPMPSPGYPYGPGTCEWHPKFTIPSGQSLGLSLRGFNAPGAYMYGWMMAGKLCDAP